jgi:hypothetical protein
MPRRKRKPGRPKGSTKLPPQYDIDLVLLLDLHALALTPKYGAISKRCRTIAAQGGVRWMRDGKVIAAIYDPDTLRVRALQALRRLRGQPYERMAARRQRVVKWPLQNGRFANVHFDVGSLYTALLLANLKTKRKITSRTRDTVLVVGKKRF